MFSSRFDWRQTTNHITTVLEAVREAGGEVLDLTQTNPTAAGFVYDADAIRTAMSKPEILEYHPHPRGAASARESVAAYYRRRGNRVDPESVFLTASTSESYACLFKLLCDPGDAVLTPQPSYPLFDFLAALESVELTPYRLHYDADTGWRVDLDHLRSLITPETRAIILVHPNNPTGSYVTRRELQEISACCRRFDLALIVDEVFLDYAAPDAVSAAVSTAGNTEALTFTLSGISKILGLPQMKLGWIQVSGPEDIRQAACRHLEVVTDTYLSVSTPVQTALADLLAQQSAFQRQVTARLDANFTALKNACVSVNGCRILRREGGWYAILEARNGISDEDMVCRLLKSDHVLTHPGYYYDISEEGCLVFSLLTRPDIFAAGVGRVAQRLKSMAMQTVSDSHGGLRHIVS